MLRLILNHFRYVREKDIEINRLNYALESAVRYEKALEGLREAQTERIRQLEAENAELRRHLNGRTPA